MDALFCLFSLIAICFALSADSYIVRSIISSLYAASLIWTAPPESAAARLGGGDLVAYYAFLVFMSFMACAFFRRLGRSTEDPDSVGGMGYIMEG